MATFVLIHGAWHYGELWHETAEALRAKGHVVHHPTIGGNEADADLRTNHAQACAPVIDYIISNGLRDVVLLGHSYGGSVISKVAEAVSDRIKRLIYWNAFVCQNGNSVLDECPPGLAQTLEKLAADRGDGGCEMPFPVWRELFIQDGTLEQAHEAYAKLRPHPIATLTDKLDLSTFYSLEIPKSYINCTEDMTLTQLPEFGWHPRMSHRLGMFRLVQMPGSHEVMFTDPVGLADAIDRAGRD